MLATRSTPEYYRVLQRFYAQLEDGHSGVYPPELVNGKLSRLPLRTRLVEGHLLVVGSREPGSDLQGLKPGDEIRTINGEAATPWAEQNIAPFVSASTRQDRDTRTYEYLPFLALLGTTCTLAAETPSGKKTIRAEQVDALGRELPRLGKAETPVRFPVDRLAPDAARRFSGAVVMLTSPRTYSAAENMAAVFNESHRGKIVGEPTGGCEGACPVVCSRPDGVKHRQQIRSRLRPEQPERGAVRFPCG